MQVLVELVGTLAGCGKEPLDIVLVCQQRRPFRADALDRLGEYRQTWIVEQICHVGLRPTRSGLRLVHAPARQQIGRTYGKPLLHRRLVKEVVHVGLAGTGEAEALASPCCRTHRTFVARDEPHTLDASDVPAHNVREALCVERIGHVDPCEAVGVEQRQASGIRNDRPMGAWRVRERDGVDSPSLGRKHDDDEVPHVGVSMALEGRLENLGWSVSSTAQYSRPA